MVDTGRHSTSNKCVRFIVAKMLTCYNLSDLYRSPVNLRAVEFEVLVCSSCNILEPWDLKLHPSLLILSRLTFHLAFGSNLYEKKKKIVSFFQLWNQQLRRLSQLKAVSVLMCFSFKMLTFKVKYLIPSQFSLFSVYWNAKINRLWGSIRNE